MKKSNIIYRKTRRDECSMGLFKYNKILNTEKKMRKTEKNENIILKICKMR